MFKVKDSSGNSKFVGRSRAKVVDNRDPLNKGRIIVNHPLLGNTVWIDYLKSPHIFDVPSIGDIVYLELDSGEMEFPIAWGNLTKGKDSSPDIPSSFKRIVPTNRGMYSPKGHKVELDDGIANLSANPSDTNLTTSGRGIKITSAAGNKIHIIEDTVNSSQYILLQDAGGNLIKLDYKNNQLTINSIGNRQDTIKGNLTITVNGNCNLTAQGNTTITSASIALNGTASGITTNNSHFGVVDFITGVPTQPSTTVTADI